MPAIVADGVTKRYGPFTALAPLRLEVEQGEVFGLLGPNGSGKTTFMRMLSGYIAPSAGRLSVAGYDVLAAPVEARRRIGYVPETVPLYRHMRVREFLWLMGRLRLVGKAELPAAIDRVIDMLALADVASKPIRHLSRGYRQRVALAQALVHDPEVLILDEPTNGLDPRQIIEVRELIHRLSGRHTVLLSSHILGEVEKVAHRVGILLGGRLLGVRRMADTPDLEAWFLSLT